MPFKRLHAMLAVGTTVERFVMLFFFLGRVIVFVRIDSCCRCRSQSGSKNLHAKDVSFEEKRSRTCAVQSFERVLVGAKPA